MDMDEEVEDKVKEEVASPANVDVDADNTAVENAIVILFISLLLPSPLSMNVCN